MLSPNTGQPMRLVEGGTHAYTLRGEQFQVGGPAWECADTGERFTTNEQDHDLLERLHQAWRARHGLGRDTLRQRRESLGLSIADAATLLGFSARQYRAYEQTDQLPAKPHALLLKLLLDEAGLAALVRLAGPALSAEARSKLPG